MHFIDSILLFGSLQGLLLAFILIYAKAFDKKSNKYLALLIAVVSIQNLSNSLINLGLDWVEYLPVSLTLLIPSSLYLFVQYIINPKYKPQSFEKNILLLFLCQVLYKLIGLIVFCVSPNIIVQKSWFVLGNVAFEFIAVFSLGIVLFVLIKQLNKYERRLLEEYADIENKTLGWIKTSLFIIIFLGVLWVVSLSLKFLLRLDSGQHLFQLLWMMISLVTYWLVYSIFVRRNVFENIEKKSLVSTVEDSRSLSDSATEYYHELLRTMKEDKLYKDPDLSMSKLAAHMNLSNGYLSLILNQKRGTHFFDFVNEFRIEEVKRELLNPDKNHYSILGVGMDAGFKSKSTFNQVFKKFTGTTPTAFRKAKQITG